MADRLLIVDAGTLQNLQAAGGPQAWGQLLKAGYRVVISSDVLREFEPNDFSIELETWVA